MSRIRWVVVCVTLAGVCAGSQPAVAEQVVEVWRGGGFSSPQCVSANPRDGSCWVADTDNNQVVHLAQDGTELWRGGEFHWPVSVSVYPSDGSCWVADEGNNQVVHLAQDGTELWRGGGFDNPISVSVNTGDGSCWVADYYNRQVVHLAKSGSQLWRGGGFFGPKAVSVNRADGSCTVADYGGHVVHLREDGTLLWWSVSFNDPFSVSVNPSDGSCWVADTYNSQVVHLRGGGPELWRGGGFSYPQSVSVNPSDGSCWVADTLNNQVVWLAQNVSGIWRSGGFSYPQSVSVNETDGSCWVADEGNNQVVHLAPPQLRTVLSSGYVTPASGDPAARFTWRVKYWNTGNAAPTSVQLGIWSAATSTTTWSTMWPLDPADANYVDGKWYTYHRSLRAGQYAYRLVTHTGDQWAYWPSPAGTYQSGPTVAPGNPLVLSSGYVTPASGATGTAFTWRVKYWNTDDAPPDATWVAIWFPSDGKSYWYSMSPLDPWDNTYTDGNWYTYSRKWLPPGAYAYRFAARQGAYWTYWPKPAGTYSSGPTVGP